MYEAVRAAHRHQLVRVVSEARSIFGRALAVHRRRQVRVVQLAC